jgi:hypothetical protein
MERTWFECLISEQFFQEYYSVASLTFLKVLLAPSDNHDTEQRFSNK